jgi:hypothetical protein
MIDETKIKGFGRSGNLAVIEIGGERFFSSVETAKRLGLCTCAFYHFKRKNKLEGRRIGRRKYYSEKELTKLLSTKE